MCVSLLTNLTISGTRGHLCVSDLCSHTARRGELGRGDLGGRSCFFALNPHLFLFSGRLGRWDQKHDLVGSPFPTGLGAWRLLTKNLWSAGLASQHVLGSFPVRSEFVIIASMHLPSAGQDMGQGRNGSWRSPHQLICHGIDRSR